MHTLIAFATQWGSKYGGINSFNTDFLSAFGAADSGTARVVCVVAGATADEIADARRADVCLVPLPAHASLSHSHKDCLFNASHGRAAVGELARRQIGIEPQSTIWLGHDRITGEAAIAAAGAAGGRSALIHHMSYAAYESFAENSRAPQEREQSQRVLFRRADVAVAVGPLLRDALRDLLGAPRPVHMLIPGLADIEAREAPPTFTAFLSGRLSDDAARIKQGHLGVAAFARAQREARDLGRPDGLCRQPRLVLRGVDFERNAGAIEARGGTGASYADCRADCRADAGTELQQFAEDYADGAINLHALPYTRNRRQLYAELSAASVALVPSWHEGFGLAAWEAIAAGVPLIVGRHSGVYRLLEDHHPELGPHCVHAIEVRGDSAFPFFHQQDLLAVVSSLKAIARDPAAARRTAGKLRDEMRCYTWSACVEQALRAFQWRSRKRRIAGEPQRAAASAQPSAAAAS